MSNTRARLANTAHRASNIVAGAEGSKGAKWLHEHRRLYGDVHVNPGEVYAIRLLELEANFPLFF